MPRAARLEIVGAIVPASVCASLDGILFGPSGEIRELVDRARTELVRYPSDAAHLDMAAHSLDRLVRRIALDSEGELRRIYGDDGGVLDWTQHLAARLYRNPRFVACPVAMRME